MSRNTISGKAFVSLGDFFSKEQVNKIYQQLDKITAKNFNKSKSDKVNDMVRIENILQKAGTLGYKIMKQPLPESLKFDAGILRNAAPNVDIDEIYENLVTQIKTAPGSKSRMLHHFWEMNKQMEALYKFTVIYDDLFPEEHEEEEEEGQKALTELPVEPEVDDPVQIGDPRPPGLEAEEDIVPGVVSENLGSVEPLVPLGTQDVTQDVTQDEEKQDEEKQDELVPGQQTEGFDSPQEAGKDVTPIEPVDRSSGSPLGGEPVEVLSEALEEDQAQVPIEPDEPKLEPDTEPEQPDQPETEPEQPDQPETETETSEALFDTLEASLEEEDLTQEEREISNTKEKSMRGDELTGAVITYKYKLAPNSKPVYLVGKVGKWQSEDIYVIDDVLELDRSDGKVFKPERPTSQNFPISFKKHILDWEIIKF